MKIAKVTRPAYGNGDVDVTLTAKVSHGKISQNYVMNATILEAELPDDLACSEDLAWITMPTSTKSDLNLPKIGPNSTKITWSSTDANLTSDGIITRPYNADGDYTAKITATVTKGQASTTKEFTITLQKYSVQEEVNKIADSITWDTIKGENDLMSNVTSKLNLISTVEHGATISWGVTSTAWIDTTTGNVTRPDASTGDSADTLTAVIRKNDADGSLRFASKAFNLTIKSEQAAILAMMDLFMGGQLGDVNVVDPSTVTTETYWTADNGAENWIDDEFWTGRNKILQKYDTDFGTTDYHFLNSYKTTPTAFDYYKVKLMNERRKGNEIPQFDRNFTVYWDKCRKNVSAGGYVPDGKTPCLVRWQAIELYLTYWLETVVNICTPGSTNTGSTAAWDPDTITDIDLTSLVDIVVFRADPTYVSLPYVKTLDWIDFSDVANPDNVLGFDTDPLNYKTKSFMTIEPGVFTKPFDENLYFFREYDANVTDAEGTVKVKLDSNEVTLMVKKAPSMFGFVNVPGQRNWRLPKTFIHELGHSVDYDSINPTNPTKLSNQTNFKDMGRWVPGSNIPSTLVIGSRNTCWPSSDPIIDYPNIVTIPEASVSVYGETLVEEDFAETFMMWFCNVDGLEQYWKRRYNYMKAFVTGSPYTPLP